MQNTSKSLAFLEDVPVQQQELSLSGDWSPREMAVLEEIGRAIRRVRHGSVQVYIQDTRVIQIDTVEKKRLDRSTA